MNLNSLHLECLHLDTLCLGVFLFILLRNSNKGRTFDVFYG